jgi:hypothetical protein
LNQFEQPHEGDLNALSNKDVIDYLAMNPEASADTITRALEQLNIAKFMHSWERQQLFSPEEINQAELKKN